MKQVLFPGNTAIDEKRISFIETVVKRLSRRQVKKISAMITPYPISTCITGDDVRGDVLKYMFCAKGIIKKGLIYLSKQLSAGVVVNITIENDAGGETKSYIFNKKQMLVNPDLNIYSSDRMTVSVTPINPEDKLTEVWISFLWVPEVKDTDVKSFLIDEIEEIELLEE